MTKIILVMDAKFAKLYDAEGLKIKSLISEHTSEEFGIHHKKQSLRTGFKTQSNGVGGHFFDPHTEPKDIDRAKFSKEISEIIKEKIKDNGFSELIIIATPKMLSLMRKSLPKLHKIQIKEVAKDLVQSAESQIAEVAFA
ncbi:host attachment protein [Candidatus Bandiella euplotis]|uniref:Host cell attachment superfamily protein n=1 Tax=Candidatus Bandiella euplotis TaxID=1664265 RepID=A0ABZ0UL91_9RICK|nr:host attachment protein [Candidatus Bandiella woodruffii]WPX96257.1 Host cell attachment superfamily protein [Candidatus Bandiella woodruffii]